MGDYSYSEHIEIFGGPPEPGEAYPDLEQVDLLRKEQKENPPAVPAPDVPVEPPAASPDERLREAGERLSNLVTLLGGYDGPGYLAAPNQGEHPDYYAAAKLFDKIMRDEKTGAAVALAEWRAALAAADREAPDEETR